MGICTPDRKKYSLYTNRQAPRTSWELRVNALEAAGAVVSHQQEPCPQYRKGGGLRVTTWYSGDFVIQKTTWKRRTKKVDEGPGPARMGSSTEGLGSLPSGGSGEHTAKRGTEETWESRQAPRRKFLRRRNSRASLIALLGASELSANRRTQYSLLVIMLIFRRLGAG